MEKRYVYRALDRLKRWAFVRWCEALRFGESPAEEVARLRYNALVDLSNDWTRARL